MFVKNGDRFGVNGHVVSAGRDFWQNKKAARGSGLGDYCKKI